MESTGAADMKHAGALVNRTCGVDGNWREKGSMVPMQEKPNDYDQVNNMVKRSFATIDFSDGTEADYLTNLRNKSCFIP